MPADIEEKLVEFQLHVIEKKRTVTFLSQIGGASETPVYFDMPSIHAVDDGAKSVVIHHGVMK
jgi:hypothetical protein